MNRNLVVFSANPRSDHSKDISGYYEKMRTPFVVELINRIGQNTGNYFFNEAVVKQLGYENCSFIKESILLDDISKGELKDYICQFDSVIYPAANLIRPNNVPEVFKFLEHLLVMTDKPITIIGAGVQLRSNEKPDKDMIRLLKMVSERSVSIGVRGEYTADVLSRYGIKNSEIIGCPSAFYSLDPYFSFQSVIDKEIKNIAINGELDGQGINFIQKWMNISGISFIMQNEAMFFYDFSDMCSDWEKMDISQSKMEERGVCLSKEEIRLIDSFLKERGLIFEGMEDWIHFMSTQDFCFGPRFHGNMAALQAGIPALWVAHDCRTRELTDYLCLPAVSYQQIEGLDIRNIMEYADYTEFNGSYPYLYERYRNFLSANGILHVLPMGNADMSERYVLRNQRYSGYWRKKYEKCRQELETKITQKNLFRRFVQFIVAKYFREKIIFSRKRE